MSYTTFDVATENAAWKPDAEPKTITVTVKVTNTGSCAGKEVVQIYAACPFGKLKKERKRLVAFGKTALLQPGESETLHLKVPTVLLESYRTGKAVYCMEAGDYDFLVGTSSRDVTLAARLTLDKTVETEHLTAARRIKGNSAGRGKRGALESRTGADVGRKESRNPAAVPG